MTSKTTKLPSEQEVEPWYEAVCALWDDPVLYHSVATRAHQIAEERYREDDRDDSAMAWTADRRTIIRFYARERR